jgi:hypothetical protein
MLAAGMVLSLTAGARADTNFSISYFGHSGHVGVGVGIGRPIVAPEGCPPIHRHGYYGPWGHPRVIHVGPPVVVRPPVIVVRPPVVREVVVTPAPPVVVTSPVPVEDGTIIVWVTNSNGSKTSVRLTRDGSWFVGPRGEYYTEMPTNEQLRIVYGF